MTKEKYMVSTVSKNTDHHQIVNPLKTEGDTLCMSKYIMFIIFYYHISFNKGQFTMNVRLTFMHSHNKYRYIKWTKLSMISGSWMALDNQNSYIYPGQPKNTSWEQSNESLSLCMANQ